MAVRVTAKGQVTIPKRIRDLLGIQAGSKVAFTLAEDAYTAFTHQLSV